MKVRSLAATAVLAISLPVTTHAQLLISEFLANPSGSPDSPREWVEVIATENIDFSVTPYTVVFTDNTVNRFGTNGWVTGGRVSYGFEITSGTLLRGEVAYVGGSSMTPTGVKLRVLDTSATAGDGFGIASTGVLGDGGGVADGVAVFQATASSITSSLRPIDAVFFGTSATGAVFLAQYELPANDLYNGGKFSTDSFVGPDPSGGDVIGALGSYNPYTGTWEAARSWSIGAFTDGQSGITLVPVPEPSTAMLLLGGALAGALMWRRRK